MKYLAVLFWTSIAWAFIHVLFLARKRAVACEGKLPPGPTPLPLVGCLFKLMSNQPHESLTELARIHGPLMAIQLGQVTTICVSSSAMAKTVLQKNDQCFAARPVVDAVQALGFSKSSVVWSEPDASWRKLRTVFNTQMFTSARLAANEGLRRIKVQQLIAHIHEDCLNGKAVNIGQAAFTTILNLISNTAFSIDLVDPSSKSAQEFKDVVWGVMEVVGKPNVVDFFPVLRPLDPQGIRRRFGSYLKKLYVIFDRMIDQRMSSRAAPANSRLNDFLDVLLDQTDENGVKLGREDIKPILGDLFVAGTDTTSTTVEWAMAELLQNPNAMEKVRSELEETLGSAQYVEESDIARLPYLQAVVKETMRLHPPAPVFPRRTVTDVEIGNFMIPKNTPVTVNVWAIGRDPNVWPNPSTFTPERFLGSDIDFKGQDFELLPFGSGRRICPGLPLAYRMLHLMLASLLHSFVWRLPNGMEPGDMDMSSKFGVTLQLATPLHAIPSLHV